LEYPNIRKIPYFFVDNIGIPKYYQTMSSTNYRNSKIKHILINQFSPNETALVKQATSKLGLRRPAFYHDAIVEKAEKVMEESSDAPNNG